MDGRLIDLDNMIIVFHWADSVIESPCPSVCVFVCGFAPSGHKGAKEVPGEQSSLPLFLRPLIGPQVLPSPPPIFLHFFCCNFCAIFLQLFFATFLQLSCNFLANLWQLSHNFLATFSQLSQNFLKTFLQLAGKFLSIF